MKHKDVIRARDRLALQLPPLTEILRGSLMHRMIRHKRGCPKCARGEGHPVCVLTVTYPGGRNRQISLHPEQHDQVQQWIDNYHALREKLERICELNHELLRPEK